LLESIPNNFIAPIKNKAEKLIKSYQKQAHGGGLQNFFGYL
jgi:hypothetical protein